MDAVSLCHCSTFGTSPLLYFNTKNSCSCPFISASKFKPSISSSSSFRVSCSCDGGENGYLDDKKPLSTSWAYGVLGLDPPFSSGQLKAAFRTKVKQFHPDVTKGGQNSDIMIRRVIQAYEIRGMANQHYLSISNRFCPTTANQKLLRALVDDIFPLIDDIFPLIFFKTHLDMVSSECMDPFEQPECEAFDLFVNEVLCVGKGCPYSCVSMAPHAFKFSSVTGTANATSQGHAEDYRVQLAVGQCPRSCIHYVTPSQRIILEELLDSILNMPYDTSAEAELLYSLIVKAKYENNRYQKPKKNPKVSSKHVDWF